jgi:hypothetical protein
MVNQKERTSAMDLSEATHPNAGEDFCRASTGSRYTGALVQELKWSIWPSTGPGFGFARYQACAKNNQSGASYHCCRDTLSE